MPNFESPITNKKFASQPMRELDVPDESGYSSNAPSREGQLAPSVSRRYGNNSMEEELRQFQERAQADMNPENSLSEAEREFRQARQDKLRGTERLNEGARKRIEMLIGMTRGTRTADIEGKTYVLQTLKGKEMSQAMTTTSEFNGTVQFSFEIRRQLLSRSLIQIAGVDVGQFVGSNTLEAKLELIDHMDDALLNRLYDEYLIMVREARDRYAIKTEEEIKEVVEDLKK